MSKTEQEPQLQPQQQTAAIQTLGCKVNYCDSEELAGLLRQLGFKMVSFKEKADVYIINTCTVTHAGDRKSRQAIRKARRKNPDAVIVAAGCFAQVAPDEVRQLPEVDLVVGAQSRHLLPELLQQQRAAAAGHPLQICPAASAGDLDLDLDLNLDLEKEKDPCGLSPAGSGQVRTRAFLKIQDGCQAYCTYCIVPYARGPLHSLTPEAVLKQAQRMLLAGYREIVLTGIHLGKYGVDLPGGINLAELLERVASLPGDFRIRLSSIEPAEISHQLVDILHSYPRICRHLHIPLQSGDSQVLKKMGRPYSASHYILLTKYLKERLPGIALTSDVMVGFPGEGEREFANTKDVIEQVAFSRLHVFKYSPRRGTPAALFPGQVDEGIKDRRSRELIELGKGLEEEFGRQLIGSQAEVLFEREIGKHLEGFSQHYVRVRVKALQAQRGEVWKVKLLTCYKNYIYGEIVSS